MASTVEPAGGQTRLTDHFCPLGAVGCGGEHFWTDMSSNEQQVKARRWEEHVATLEHKREERNTYQREWRARRAASMSPNQL